ncbi:MAG: pseudouridylate synthase [Verrucomicrobiae bacterium]|nr:pseudouridylate synthase [Verrucomicrobiae bacterium]NNJ42871.1 pseudouridylate synthase [Akkermansiaceae bacterium]
MDDASPPLTILYQDDWLVAVDKPAGHLVHPANTPTAGDQVTMKILRDQIGQHVHPIHRLDRPTTGVLLFGLDPKIAHQLHKALERHQIQKSYRAIVHGLAPSEPWHCREPIQKSAQAPAREAHTSFKRLDICQPQSLQDLETDTLSLIDATPHTGRYHQIRRHLLHAALPIVGDYRYAGIEISNQLGSLLGTGTRMLLQAKRLTLTHPVSNQELIIEAPVDPYFLHCFPNLN